MAIITEEPDSPNSPTSNTPKRNSKPAPTTTSATASGSSCSNSATTTSAVVTRQNPFHFWLYFTVIVSFITLIFICFSFFIPEDPKAWFLNLPNDLRKHYSSGRAIKVQTSPNQPQVEVFTFHEGPMSSDHVLIVHGLGCNSFAFRGIVKTLGRKGVHAVVIDLPGSGFSDKSMAVVGEKWGGILGRFWEIYSDIKEKGLFWGFDQLVEQGYVNYQDNDQVKVTSKREIVKAIELGPEEMGRVLGQVIDSLGLAPVDLVLHDSALGFCANWVSDNPGLVRSVVLLDSPAKGAAFPLWLLQIPVVREVTTGFNFLFGKVLEMCCLRSISFTDVEAHRILLKGRNGREAVVGMGKRLNCSFDLDEWSGLDGVKDLPMQVIWSSDWSKEWSEEGRRVADAIPRARFLSHSGGRWPQENSAFEVAESIYQFISTLPKSTRHAEVEEHVKKMFYKPKSRGDDHHHHHDDSAGHDHQDAYPHVHAAGYNMDAYGLEHRWEI